MGKGLFFGMLLMFGAVLSWEHEDAPKIKAAYYNEKAKIFYSAHNECWKFRNQLSCEQDRKAFEAFYQQFSDSMNYYYSLEEKVKK